MDCYCSERIQSAFIVLRVEDYIIKQKDKPISYQSHVDMIRDSYTGMFNVPLEEAF